MVLYKYSNTNKKNDTKSIGSIAVFMRHSKNEANICHAWKPLLNSYISISTVQVVCNVLVYLHLMHYVLKIYKKCKLL